MENPRKRKSMSEAKKLKCQECGQEIDKEEHEANNGLCDTCTEEEEEFPIWEF